MKFLTDSISSDENWDDDCDYALVELSQTDAETILTYLDEYAKMKETIPSLLKLEVSGFYATFFQEFNKLQNIRGEMKDGKSVLPEDFEVPDAFRQSVECSMVNVCENGVYFNAFVKHTKISVETAFFTIKELKKIAKK